MSKEEWKAAGNELMKLTNMGLSETEKKMIKTASEKAPAITTTTEYLKQIHDKRRGNIANDKLVNEKETSEKDHIIKNPHSSNYSKSRHGGLYDYRRFINQKEESNRDIDPNQAFRNKRNDKG